MRGKFPGLPRAGAQNPRASQGYFHVNNLWSIEQEIDDSRSHAILEINIFIRNTVLPPIPPIVSGCILTFIRKQGSQPISMPSCQDSWTHLALKMQDTFNPKNQDKRGILFENFTMNKERLPAGQIFYKMNKNRLPAGQLFLQNEQGKTARWAKFYKMDKNRLPTAG